MIHNAADRTIRIGRLFHAIAPVTAAHTEGRMNKTCKQKAFQTVRQAKRCATKIRHKAVVGGIFGRFSTSTNADWKQLVTSYPVWLETMSAWMFMQHVVNLG